MILSIIIPLYNEERRFHKTENCLKEFISSQKIFERIEVIFVNDGSQDKTKEIIEEFSKQNGSKVVSYDKNMGKGYAIKQGMATASGDYALFLDADMSTEPSEISKFIDAIKSGEDVIIGSRRSHGSQVLISQPLYRKLMGMAFTKIANIILGMDIPDFTCGFKCFSRKAREEIFTRSVINRWSFDTEILFLAKARDFKIIPVPVTWKNDLTTTVRLGRDVVRSFIDLLQIRKNHVLGKYK